MRSKASGLQREQHPHIQSPGSGSLLPCYSPVSFGPHYTLPPAGSML